MFVTIIKKRSLSGVFLMKTTTESLQLTGFEEILEDQELTVSSADYSLLTDLYQLTMAACYVGEGLDGRGREF